MPDHGEDRGGVENTYGQPADVHQVGESARGRKVGDLRHNKPDGDPGGSQKYVGKDPIIAAHGINACL
ncbi:MAG: hypothetical protein EBR18_00750 [Betaproteobacteria bacterium]|nr:hypothetical protein [Betaproteobacteria bacterium]